MLNSESVSANCIALYVCRNISKLICSVFYRFNSTALHFSFVVVAVLVFLPSPEAYTQEKRAWQTTDSFREKQISDLQASPSGEELIFVLSESSLEDNASYSNIWLWSQGSDAVSLTDPEGSVSSPRWSPDGETIAYFASDESGLGLWTMNADGSGKRKLTNLEQSNAYLAWGGVGNDLSWSPDGDQLAFSAAGPRYYEKDIDPPHLPTGNDVMVIDRLLHKTIYFYSDLRRTHIWVISADGDNLRQISSGDYDYHSFSWSPDGAYIACVSNQTGRDDFNANNDIVLLSADGEGMRQLTHSSGPEYQVTWSPDGTRLAYIGRERSNRSKESDAELKKLYVRAVEDSEPVEASQPLDRWVNDFSWGEGGGSLYFTVQNEGRVELHSSSVEQDGSIAAVVTDRGQVGDFAVTDDETIYYVYSDSTHFDEIYRIAGSGARPEKLTSFNDVLLDEVEIVEPELFSFHSFDGLRIDGWILKPVGFREGETYPLILSIHGGPHGQYGYRISSLFQELAAAGYAVLFMNPRGSTGRGQAFSDLVVGDIAGGDYHDIMAGLDYAIGRYDFIDAENMGVTGVSYGGYLTNWVVTHTDRFDAAVSVSGISNLIGQWSEGSNSLWFESDMEIMPFEDYDRAWEVSPLKYVVGATTPLLFVNGRWDFITSVNQADSMFVALKKMGVDTQIALYPNEGHGVGRQPKHRADYHRRAIGWFDKYLK